MATKGQKFQRYSEEIRKKAVHMHEKQGKSYRVIAEELEIRNVSQVKAWVKKYRNLESLEDKRSSNPFMGRPRTTFRSVVEERDYLKAQVEYLKKHYPNLHKERGSRK